MADKWAVGTGNWSDTATWNDGIKPGASDDVYADNKTVTIDENATVLSVRTTQRSGGTAGGGFTLADGITLTCTGSGVIAGTTNCVTFSANSPATATINSGVTGSSTTNTTAGVNVSGSGTLDLNGDLTGGSGGSVRAAVLVSGTGILNLVGNTTSYVGASGVGIRLTSAGTINITGNVAGGSNTGNVAIVSNNTGTVNITGDVTGGSGASTYAINNLSHGSFNVTGTVTGGSFATAPGIYYTAAGTGVINITGNLVANTAPAVVQALDAGTIIVRGNLQCSASGIAAIGGGKVLIHPSDDITHAYRTWNGSSVDAERVLSTASGSGSARSPIGLRGGMQ